MTPPVPDEILTETVLARAACATDKEAAAVLGIARSTLQNRLMRAAERGLSGTRPVMTGYAIKSVSSKDGDSWIKQVKEHGEAYTVPEGHSVKGESALVDAEGRTIQKWVKTNIDAAAQKSKLEAMVSGFVDVLPRADPIAGPTNTLPDLLCQYTLTDAHLGALAWNEETGGGDYDLSIGARLVIDWFAAAIATSPSSRRAVFAQLGDFLHYDSFKSVTPEHGHLLDGDTRYPKMVRSAIRIVRTVIRMLLEKHEQIDIIMADANHDPSSEVWLREMLSAFYDHEPRIRVDTNPGTYSMIEHGDVSLFYHHGHRRGVGNVDSVFVGKFRQAYGRTRFSYAHVGHKHADELKTTNLMKVEQHETLAAPDAYASNGGWLSGRSAKVIYYHSKFGYVGRNIMTPEMVAGAFAASNDNTLVGAAA